MPRESAILNKFPFSPMFLVKVAKALFFCARNNQKKYDMSVSKQYDTQHKRLDTDVDIHLYLKCFRKRITFKFNGKSI